MKITNVGKLIISVLIAEGAGLIGSLFTTPAIATWYQALAKPSFNPPAWVFAPVWTILFLLMAVAAFLVWKKGWQRREVKAALAVYFSQLVLNIIWSGLFFGLHNPFAAFIEIFFLWATILMTMIYFSKISKTAAWLLLPYILWVSFAAFLNYSIWIISLS